MKNPTDLKANPLVGDTLVIEKYHSSFVRKGNKVVRNVRPTNSVIDAVYEDGKIRSKEGDMFSVKLKHAATDKQKAQWKTFD